MLLQAGAVGDTNVIASAAFFDSLRAPMFGRFQQPACRASSCHVAGTCHPARSWAGASATTSSPALWPVPANRTSRPIGLEVPAITGCAVSRIWQCLHVRKRCGRPRESLPEERAFPRARRETGSHSGGYRVGGNRETSVFEAGVDVDIFSDPSRYS